MFIERTDAEAETPILWPRDMQNWLTGKDPDTGRDWRQEEKGMTEDEMVGWYHWLDRHWVWVGSRSWWWTGRPGVLQSMGWQRVGHDWVTELNWTEIRLSVLLQLWDIHNTSGSSAPLYCLHRPYWSIHSTSIQAYVQVMTWGSPIGPTDNMAHSVPAYHWCSSWAFGICCLVTRSCPTLCKLMDCCTPGSSVLHSLPERAQTHVQ